MFEIMKSVMKLEFVPCHRMPERSLHIGGKKSPLCARCMSILVGYLFIVPLIFVEIPLSLPIYLLIGCLLNIPMVTDGYTQLRKWRKSNNTLRVVTGLLSGLGQSMLVVGGSQILISFII